MWEWLHWITGGIFTTRGSIEVGGNGSMHTITRRRFWRATEVVDPAHPAEMYVRLRYHSREAALAACDRMLIVDESGVTVLHLQVPVIPRTTMQEDLPAEVRVQW